MVIGWTLLCRLEIQKHKGGHDWLNQLLNALKANEYVRKFIRKGKIVRGKSKKLSGSLNWLKKHVEVNFISQIFVGR